MIIGKHIYLRFFEESDIDKVLQYRIENIAFHQKFSPTFSEDFCTADGVKNMIESAGQNGEHHHSMGIFLKDNDELIGDVSIFKFERGPINKCMIGYGLAKKHNGKGYMSEAVKLFVDYVFETYKFHRIEGGAMPSNIGSIRVMEKAGFEKEGIERKGVKINGVWEDHQILSILSEND